MTDYFKKQIQEINQSMSLRLYGLALALTHVWTFFYWNQYRFFVNAQAGQNSEPLCFPLFPDCDLFRASLSPNFWWAILILYLFTAVLTVFFFTNKKDSFWGYIGLIDLTLIKLFLHLSNYNFMGNYHYMIHLVSFAYLFLPHKKLVIKYLIVFFYIAAGFLKINIDWLSGAAMITTPYLQGRLLDLSLQYVIFLELVFVFGLLSKHKWIFRFTLLQFIAFHIFSWHIVGFFYPMVMFCLLSIFVLEEYFKEKKTNHFKKFFTGKEPLSLYVVTLVFVTMQAFPFAFTNDPSLSGAFRLSSLNMFDSKTTCKVALIAHSEGDSAHLDRPMKSLGVRLGCDPIVFLNQAHQLCRKNREAKEFDRLSLALLSKRVTQSRYTKVLDISDVCALKNPLWAEFAQRGEH